MRTALVLTALAVLCGLAAANPAQVLRRLDNQSYAALSSGHGLHLDVRVENEAQLMEAVRNYTGHFDAPNFSLSKLGVVRPNAKRALIPFAALAPLFQKSVIAEMWPQDKLQGSVWVHRVRYSGYETLWSISEWFTGAGRNYKAIKRASGRSSDRIGENSVVKIPANLLLDILTATPVTNVPQPKDPVFANQTQLQKEVTLVRENDPVPVVSAPGTESEPPADAADPATGDDGQEMGNGPQDRETSSEKKDDQQPQPTPSPEILRALAELEVDRRDLAYGQDSKGLYAQYRLKAGEAIYSAVVVRFCGLVRADDVNRVAAEIIERNGFPDETDLAIGTPIRIPYAFLEPEFKREDDSEYLAYVKNLKEVAALDTQLTSRNLEGVHIILDSGHGGRDPGAHFGWVWEDDYVYDIVCRVKQRLESETSAKVHTTVLDPSVQFKVQNVSRFTRDHDEVLLTQPVFSLNTSRVTDDGVNLRWMLANNRFEVLTSQGITPENILFASFHADSLHPSLRGTMVYVPDARVYPKRLPEFSKFRKYREYHGNQTRFTQKSVQEAQALSMSFASHLLRKSREAGILVHRQKPVRSLIHKNPRRPYVPAVLNYNRVPTRCLIEVCNLNNRTDRELLRDYRFRQQFADAFVEAVYAAYGVPHSSAAVSSLTSSAKGAE